MRYLKIITVICFLSLASSCNNQKTSISYYDAVYGYAETVVIESSDKTEIYISGQVGEGNTLKAQMLDALKNLKSQLQKHEADYENLIKINTYIVDYKPDDLNVFRDVRKEVFGENIVPASTLVGVQSLALPDWKIEIDAVAIIVK